MFSATLLTGFLFLCPWTIYAAPSPPPIDWKSPEVIVRDVCVIGGGASGTYAAVRLGDLKQSVIVVEQKGRLGGHTETFTDPVTGAKIDIGVRVWHNTSLVTNFFARFGVALTVADFSTTGITSEPVDFRTGIPITGITPVDPTAALGAYAAQLAQYPYLETGFELPNPVPADLLLPFQDFVTKYNIQAAVATINGFNQGIGDLLTTPTLYVMKLFGLSIIQGLQTGFLTSADHDNSEIYEKIQAILKASHSLLLNSTVISTDRDCDDDGYARIVVSTSCGIKYIRAKKIVLSIPPTLKNLANFDLDNTEKSLFEQFSTSGYYTGLIRNSGIPDNLSLLNVAADSPFGIQDLPGLYQIAPTGVTGLHNILYGSPTALGDDQVKSDIIASVLRLKSAGTLDTTTPEFAVFSSHAPFEFTVSADAIENGFYTQLIALQGQRHVFYTGAAFHTQDTSLLWEFTEALLAKIVA